MLKELIVSAMLAATPAQNSNCGNAAAAQALVDEYKEIALVTFLDENERVIMVYGNLDTGTTTVFASPIGQDVYCVISSGVQLKIGGPERRPEPGPRARPGWSPNGGDL